MKLIKLITMFLSRKSNVSYRVPIICRYFASNPLESEFTTTPQYPPILDTSYEAKKQRKKEQEWEQIKSVKSIEEKQIKLNMPRYYGFKTFMIPENNLSYGNLTLIQHITRTHLLKSDNLPQFYNKIDVKECRESLKSEIENIFSGLEYYSRAFFINKQDLSAPEIEDILSSIIIRKIHDAVMNVLSNKYKHLSDLEATDDARIESTWVAGGMAPPESVKKQRRSFDFIKHTENDPLNRYMCYVGQPVLTLRSKLPLLPLLASSEYENQDLHVPSFELDPQVIGIWTEQRHIANTPGFWPGEKNEFGFLSYHKRGHILKRTFDDPNDKPEALDCQGISSSFGWLNAQANFQGFNFFNEITYPFISQAIITNGKLWSFYVYQLNTLLMHSEHIYENPKRNVCWATPEMKLYEDIQGGRLIGFNDEVLEMLLRFYANVPEERLGVNLKPYVDSEFRVSADYKDDEKTEWLEREYKFLTSNRPRHHLPYEVYHWEKIYKIDHKTRPMDARRRPFELFENPYKRTLDDRKPRYIPRALRPDLKRNRGRDAKEFFP